ncbi:Cyanophycin synthetase [bioreactor metagenome]
MLGLDICGIDICTEDISKPIIHNNGIVMEVNAAPGLRMHLSPSEGAARDLGKEIVNMLYNNNPYNIPVISITGTNGKTTVTRVISHTLSKMGYCVGMTSTSGIYINDECIDSGDDTGFESAKSILINKDVDVAVLETARGGMIKKGLAYDLADVSVITNITQDHLGIDGINTMEELCYVKSLVGEAVKEDGYVVLNADDYWSKSILNRIKANIILFSKDSNNPLLKQNKLSNICVYLENKNIVVVNEGKKHTICNIDEVPITLGGKLMFNVENILATCGALVGLKIDYCMIKNGITSYLLNSDKNAGRFNCYNVNGVNVILDYGHNIDGYNAVLSAVKYINKGKLYGIVGIPGDRSDDMALEIGKISSHHLDYIIVKEDKDLRGRKQGEIAQLIVDGVKKRDTKKKYEVVLREEEALIKALNISQKGDTIVMFFEDMAPLVNIINEFSIYKDENSYIDKSISN